jgi:D-aspartate ligase
MSESSADNIHGVIVLGGHIQALGIVRIIGQKGIPVVVVDRTTRCIARRSKFCGAFHEVVDDRLEEFLTGDLCITKYKNWIIFPTDDFHVRILSMNREKLEQHFIVSTDTWEVIETFYNKKKTYRLAEQSGIPIPRTFFPGNQSDLNNTEINYPCIIKPAVMVDFYRKVGKKVLLCRSINELRMNYSKALKVIAAEEIIVQEIIPGDGRNQVSACFLFLDGHSYVSLTACRLRQHPVDFGNATTYAEIIEEPSLIETGEKLLNAAHYNGLCEIEFKRDDRDNTYKLLEVNPRTWKWHSIADKAGTPFLPLYIDYLMGKKIRPVTCMKKASFCHMATDLPIRLVLLLKGFNYWNRKLKPVQNAVWSADDPAPWFYEKLHLLYYLFSR